ncbi:MAG TPA: prephenate dehydrogenase/arogenate dehydrogenase family protein [Spongiibacteraceae bacterium]|nr:prephenate dehydrogenase/arogenate dehydrogenase family protein [Spongiibacteraceae bacterium]
MSDRLPLGRVAIVGLGLIGGSLAAALKAGSLAADVVAWGRRESTLQEGLRLGVIDRYSLSLADAVRGADLVVIATPTLVVETVIEQLAAVLDAHTVVSDAASVKANVVAAARRAFNPAQLARFVPGHPIAGSERSGVGAADAALYRDHRVILTPLPESDAGAVALVDAVWQAVGAEVVTMSVAEHDRILAATSHLPHMLAFTLVDALAAQTQQRDIFRFAAGGFRDFTRIASSDPQMWHDIALANRAAILTAIDDFSQHLARLRGAIDDGDGAGIMATFQQAKAARDRFAAMFSGAAAGAAKNAYHQE